MSEQWYCLNCEEPLEIMYDERDNEYTPIVCANCGKANTTKLGESEI